MLEPSEPKKTNPAVSPHYFTILRVPSISILFRDPNLSRKPPETQGEWTPRTMIKVTPEMWWVEGKQPHFLTWITPRNRQNNDPSKYTQRYLRSVREMQGMRNGMTLTNQATGGLNFRTEAWVPASFPGGNPGNPGLRASARF